MIQTKTFLEKYREGQRDFKNHNLSQVKIYKENLENIDFSGGNLTCANFIEVNLRGANFSKCNLKGIHLKRCNLAGAIFNESDLSHGNLNNSILKKAYFKNSNLSQAHITQVNLSSAYLVGANLISTSLNNSDLSFSNFTKSNLTNGFLTEANLTETIFHEAILDYTSLIKVILKKTSFRDAKYNSQTLFDIDFKPEQWGMKKHWDVTIGQILDSLNYLSKIGSHYLGNLISVKYLDNSRPNFAWIHQFEISSKGLISFRGKLTDNISFSELKWYQQWVKQYLTNCSIMLKNFGNLIEAEKVVDYQGNIMNFINSSGS